MFGVGVGAGGGSATVVGAGAAGRVGPEEEEVVTVRRYACERGAARALRPEKVSIGSWFKLVGWERLLTLP